MIISDKINVLYFNRLMLYTKIHMLGPWFTGCIAVATDIQRCVERELLPRARMRSRDKVIGRVRLLSSLPQKSPDLEF